MVDKVNGLEPEMQKLSDDELLAKTVEFRERLGVDISESRKEKDPFAPAKKKTEKEAQNAEDRKKLDEILPEAFAAAREAANRALIHRAFDVQVLGGVFLSQGFVSELFTGEGKSLVAIMPLYLYALMGKGVHLVTVNDYLARRDGEWVGHAFHALGMTVGVITPGASYRFISDEEVLKLKGDEGKEALEVRKNVVKKSGRLLMSSMKGSNLIQCSKDEAYACDVVYGTNNEFGFDYLRDNMARDLDQRVQGKLYYAIVDECDSILIDEARTPLIISSPAEDSNELYRQFARIASNLKPVQHYVVDEKANSVTLTDEGVSHAEKLLGSKNMWENYAYVHHLDNALKAKELFQKDDHYLVQDGEIRIVDEFTGRVLPGRRYSEGLHQAIEAKENVEVKRESRTLATITFQNFFRLYDFLAGMTATALTESEEFAQIYNLEVIVVPTNKPVIRKDYSDVVFRTKEGKFRAVIKEIKEMHEKGRPVLVGTASVENSEEVSGMLNKEGIPHEVLNAKHHEKEAMIVAKAGEKGNVTISTNMAGRGTDISLGEGVVELGGLHVLGTERHESRRIDNQLRGRSGRQGDPGSSRFYVSFEDDLMRIFGGDAMGNLLARVGMDDDMPVEAGLIGRSIESAQKKVESYNFDTRKHLVEYDDVLNQQREIVYDLRRKILAMLKEAQENPIKSEIVDIAKVKYDWDKVTEENISDIAESIKNVSLKNPATWDVEFFKSSLGLGGGDNSNPDDVLSRPMRMWVLKLTLQHIDFILSAQLKDDSQVDEKEERNLLAGVQDVVPLELGQVAVNRLGYNNWREFEKKFTDSDDPEWQREQLYRLVITAYILHVRALGDSSITVVERELFLQTIDKLWVDHLDLMTDLRHGITLRGYAQRNPLVEYKNEGFAMFDRMLSQMEEDIVRRFYKVKAVRNAPALDIKRAKAVHEEVPGAVSQVKGPDVGGRQISAPVPAMRRGPDNRPGEVSKQKTVVNTEKVGRNDPCPCGSGKKYKKCCYPKYG